jgi:hypothetical protein
MEEILHWVIMMYFLHPICLHILSSNLWLLEHLPLKSYNSTTHNLTFKPHSRGPYNKESKMLPHHSTWHCISASSHPSPLSFFDLPVQGKHMKLAFTIKAYLESKVYSITSTAHPLHQRTDQRNNEENQNDQRDYRVLPKWGCYMVSPSFMCRGTTHRKYLIISQLI